MDEVRLCHSNSTGTSSSTSHYSASYADSSLYAQCRIVWLFRRVVPLRGDIAYRASWPRLTRMLSVSRPLSRPTRWYWLWRSLSTQLFTVICIHVYSRPSRCASPDPPGDTSRLRVLPRCSEWRSLLASPIFICRDSSPGQVAKLCCPVLVDWHASCYSAAGTSQASTCKKHQNDCTAYVLSRLET